MTRKRWLQLTSAAAILMVPVGLGMWIKGLAIEEWSASQAAIDLAWTIIPFAIVVAIVTGFLASREPTPDGERDRVGLWLAGIAILIGIGIVVSLLNLGIR